MIAFLNSKDAALGKGCSFDEVYFDTGSATLKPESSRQIEQLAGRAQNRRVEVVVTKR